MVFITLSLPQAVSGLKYFVDCCLLKAAQLKMSSAILVFLVWITRGPLGSLGCFPAGELALLSAGNMDCFDACQLAMSGHIKEEKRGFLVLLFWSCVFLFFQVCLYTTWISMSSLLLFFLILVTFKCGYVAQMVVMQILALP